MTATTERRRTGRPALTDRAAILAAARSIGFADLTVGKAGAAVGVRYSTFYRHFPSLAALTDALLDDVLADVAWPDDHTPDLWRTHLHELHATVAATADRWPGLVDALAFEQRRAEQRLPSPLAAALDVAEQTLTAAGHNPTDAAAVVGAAVTLALHTPPAEHGRALELIAAGLETEGRG